MDIETYKKIEKSFIEMSHCFSPFLDSHHQKRLMIDRKARELKGNDFSMSKAIIAYHWEFEIKPLLDKYLNI